MVPFWTGGWQRVWGDERQSYLQGWGVCRGVVPLVLGCLGEKGFPQMWGLLRMEKGNVCLGSPALLSNKPPSPWDVEAPLPPQPSGAGADGALMEPLRR